MVQYTDKTLMPFGEFRGFALVNVPASKLLWYYNNLPKMSPSLRKYIEENRDVLEMQAKASRKTSYR